MTDTRNEFHESESQAVPPVRSGEVAHTPGPWIATTEGISGRRVFMPDDTVEIRSKDGRGLIACLYVQNWAGKQDEANARLIAAAPDLYDAIRNSDDAHWTTAMRAAMAKVEGRS